MTLLSDADSGDSPVRHVVIIGAGLGGIACAIALQRQLGFTNVTIYEKEGDVGGTWRDNTYPGCGCDTPTHWYSLSSDLNPYWSTVVAPQPEVFAYWKTLAEKYDLYTRTVFHTAVLSAMWDPERQEYDVEIEDVQTGARSRTRASVVLSAVGLLVEPKVPEALKEKGLERFKGPMFHSAKWQHGVELGGRRIAVIGNSASAAQFIPKLASNPGTHVVNFCRTPNWFLPTILHGEYSAWQKWIFAKVPLALQLYRNWIVLGQMIVPILRTYLSKITGAPGPENSLAQYIKRTAPAEYHDKLIPDYPVVCRRPILDPGYLACLHQPNLKLVWDPIAEITESGITTAQGEQFQVDAIILATGFVTDRNPVRIVGSAGETLDDHFAKNGGPSAYYGVSVPGFPNFFLVGGPNTVTGRGSAVFTHEIGIDYMMRVLRPLLHSPAASSSLFRRPSTGRAISVRPEAHDAFNERLQTWMSATTYLHCASWSRAGSDGLGKNFTNFPGSLLYFWWTMRKVHWEDYVIKTTT